MLQARSVREEKREAKRPNRSGRGRVDGEDHPVALPLSHAKIRAALAEGRRIKLGNEYKGAVLDLRGLEDLQLPEHRLVDVVNGLIRVVRERRKARVLIDPAEPWTRTKTLLGNLEDRRCERKGRSFGKDGSVLLHLRARLPATVRPRETRRPAVEVLVEGVRRLDRATGEYEVRGLVRGRHECRRVTVPAENDGTGAVLAVAAWLKLHGGSSAALPARGAFEALRLPLTSSPEKGHSSLDFGDAVRCLRAGWRWREEAGWLVGVAL